MLTNAPGCLPNEVVTVHRSSDATATARPFIVLGPVAQRVRALHVAVNVPWTAGTARQRHDVVEGRHHRSRVLSFPVDGVAAETANPTIAFKHRQGVDVLVWNTVASSARPVVGVERNSRRHDPLVLVSQTLATRGLGTSVAAAAAVAVCRVRPMLAGLALLAGPANGSPGVRSSLEPKLTLVANGPLRASRAFPCGPKLSRVPAGSLAFIGAELRFRATLGAPEPLTAPPARSDLPRVPAAFRLRVTARRAVRLPDLSLGLGACFEYRSAAKAFAGFYDRRSFPPLPKTLVRAVASPAAFGIAERRPTHPAWTQIGHPRSRMGRAKCCPLHPQTVLAVRSQAVAVPLVAAKFADRLLLFAAGAPVGHQRSLRAAADKRHRPRTAAGPTSTRHAADSGGAYTVAPHSHAHVM
jgi:hypothetical protein